MAVITLTETAIANRALQYVGGTLLTDIWADTSRNAAAIQACYHMVRRAEMRRNVWRFAIRETVLRALDRNTRVVTFGSYDSTVSYAQYDIVLGSDSRVYFSLEASNSGNDPSTRLFTKWSNYCGPDTATEYITDYSTTTTYDSQMHSVGSDGNVYYSLIDSNINNDPVTDDGTHWDLVANNPIEEDNDTGATSMSFFTGELVYVGRDVYVSIASSNDNDPTTDTEGEWLALTTAATLSTTQLHRDRAIVEYADAQRFQAPGRFPS